MTEQELSQALTSSGITAYDTVTDESGNMSATVVLEGHIAGFHTNQTPEQVLSTIEAFKSSYFGSLLKK